MRASNSTAVPVSRSSALIAASLMPIVSRATGFDMVADGGWRPTVDNYLGRVTKTRIEAIREGAGERAAQLIYHLKKGDIAKEAERLLAEIGWLPEPLRLADLDADVANIGDSDDGDTLPDLLANDGVQDDVAEAEEHFVPVAAE